MGHNLQDWQQTAPGTVLKALVYRVNNHLTRSGQAAVIKHPDQVGENARALALIPA